MAAGASSALAPPHWNSWISHSLAESTRSSPRRARFPSTLVPLTILQPSPLCVVSIGISVSLSAFLLSRSLSNRVLLSPPPQETSLRVPASALRRATGPAIGTTTLRTSSHRSASAAMASASIGTPAQQTISLPAQKEHKATVVFLHGLGDTGAGWADIPVSLNLPHVKWVFPSAPIKPVSINGGFPCPSWFDIFGLSADSREDKEGIDKAARYVADLLAREKDAAPKDAKIIVGGFSQGGALSLHLTARKHAGTFLDGSDASKVPLDGTICLSGWLPLYSTLKGADLTFADAAALYKILMCHGEADTLVQFPFGKLSAQELTTLGFSALQFKAYPGLPHSASPQELQDVELWLKDVTSQ